MTCIDVLDMHVSRTEWDLEKISVNKVGICIIT